MNKTLILIIVIAVILVVGWVWWTQQSKSPVLPQIKTSSQNRPSVLQQPNDTTASISKQLNAVDTGSNLDQEFYSIDQDVNVL